MPGAVAAAQAVPDDCEGGASGENFCRNASALVEAEGFTTVMSAPMRVSQNGVSDCLTETAEAPFGLAFDDHDGSLPAAFFAAVRPFGAVKLSVEASTLSWLQSSLSGSMSVMSTSLISRAGAPSSVAASAGSPAGGACAPAATIVAILKPAASNSSPDRLIPVLKIITPPDASRPNMRRFWRKIMAGYFGSGLGHKIAKTTPCKVGWTRPTAPARFTPGARSSAVAAGVPAPARPARRYRR